MAYPPCMFLSFVRKEGKRLYVRKGKENFNLEHVAPVVRKIGEAKLDFSFCHLAVLPFVRKEGEEKGSGQVRKG